ncbi:MAG TPA: lysophospholipid acyltransferase family protein [Chitinophagaceae bacterium]|nr:lysophospholipid acyltransferase family protein [Chitinophagaceae bacterium]
MARKFAQPFYTTYIILMFGATLFIVLPFYLLLSLPKTLQSRKAMWALTRFWSRTWLLLAGMPVRVYGNFPDATRRLVLISNHVSYLDAIVIFAILPHYFRPLAKAEIAKAPLFGFIYKQIALLIDRSTAQTRAKSTKMMWRTLEEECAVFIFPEGTFNETQEPMKSFHDGAFRMALKTGTPIVPIILPDTKQRWHYSHWWKIWPGRNRAYVLEPISVADYTENDVALLREHSRALMSESSITLQ